MDDANLSSTNSDVPSKPETLFELLWNHRITPHRLKILQLKCRAVPDADCSEMLFISPSTIRSHVAKMVHLTGCRNRRELISWAWVRGIPDVDLATYETWVSRNRH